MKAVLVPVFHSQNEKCGEDEAIISLDVCSERRRGNGQKLQQGKLNQYKLKILTMSVVWH